ncbi:AAA family ATPase [Nostoc sp. UHCC 0702]|nr:AAA family ATPase [Nostoc sp. UHCC 0702]
MDGKRFIHSIRLENFLSYGSEGEEIELQPLNVLIGANTSGKSNFIESIRLLRAIPTDLNAAIRKGGGVYDFLWKGDEKIPLAEIKVIFEYPQGMQPLVYKLIFTASGQKFSLVDEAIENEHLNPGQDNIYFYYRLNHNGGLAIKPNPQLSTRLEKLDLETWDYTMIQTDQSILSQLQDPRKYPEITYLRNQLSQICLYCELPIGRYGELRNPQKFDLPEHPLLEDGSNLGIVLNNLQYQLGNRQIIDCLKKFYEDAEELNVRIYGGTVQIFIREEGLIQPIPANRLSDGTLRYLFLMALLLDPTPPPLICIEEPEIGLHPDILPTIAQMLIEASGRTQIIVTTHSDALVSALSEYPETVLVCERDEKGSHLRRLEPDKLKNWLES